MSAFVFDLLGHLTTLVLVFVQTRLLPMRRPWLFMLCACGVMTVAFVLKHTAAALGTPLNLVAFLLEFLILPLAFYRRDYSLAVRLMACGASVAIMFLGELAGGLVWTLAGGTFGNYAQAAERPAMSVALHVLFVCIILLAGYLLRPVLQRGHDDGASLADDALFAAVPLTQVTLLWLVLVSTQTQGSFAGGADDARFFLVGSVLFCVVFLAVAGLTAQRVHYRRARAEQARAAEVEARLDAQLAAYARLAERVETTARLRHGMRNHLQVIGALVEQGETARGREYVASVRAVLADEATGDLPTN